MCLEKCNSVVLKPELRPDLDAISAWTLASSWVVRNCKRAETEIFIKESVCYGNKWSMQYFYEEINSKIALKAPEGGWSEEGYRYFFIIDHSRTAFKSMIEEGVVKGNETRHIVLPLTSKMTEFNFVPYVGWLSFSCRLYIQVPRRVMENDSASVLSGMLRLHTLGSPSLDLTLKTAVGEVKAHSCVFNEVQSTKYAQGDTIDVPNVKIEVLKELVQYCYVGEVSTKMVQECPLETILLAEHLQVLPLVKAMISLLPLIITSTNALDLMMKSSECSREINEAIQTYTFDFIRHNLKDFDHEKLVRDLPREKLVLLIKSKIVFS